MEPEVIPSVVKPDISITPPEFTIKRPKAPLLAPVKLILLPALVAIVAVPALLNPENVMASPAVKLVMIASPAVLKPVKPMRPPPLSVKLLMAALPAVLTPEKLIVPAKKLSAIMEFAAVLPPANVNVPRPKGLGSSAVTALHVD